MDYESVYGGEIGKDALTRNPWDIAGFLRFLSQLI